MKQVRRFALFVVLLALIWPSAVYARDLFDDEVIFGGSYTLEEGETLNGNLVVFGGAVTLKTDSTVNGDVVLLGGTVEGQGVINGSLVGIGGVLRLGEAAQVNGDLVTVGAVLQREDGAQINGQVIQGGAFPFHFNPSADVKPVPKINFDHNPALGAVWFVFRMFIWAALAILLVIFFVKPTERVAQAALNEPLITAGAGLLTAVLSPIAVLALAVTIILIPVAFVLVLLLALAWLFGWIALGLEVGRRVAKMLKMEWAPAIAAGVGTFILYFVLAGFAEIVPCVGGLPRAVVGLWGLGAVLMTYFGTRDYQSAPQVMDVPQDEAPALAVAAPTPEEQAAPPSGDESAPDENPPEEAADL